MLYLCVGLIPEESKINANGQQLFSNDLGQTVHVRHWILSNLSRIPRPSCRSHLFFTGHSTRNFGIRRSDAKKETRWICDSIHGIMSRKACFFRLGGWLGDLQNHAKPSFVGFFSVFSHHHAKVCSPINLVSQFTMFQVHSSFKFVFFMLFKMNGVNKKKHWVQSFFGGWF